MPLINYNSLHKKNIIFVVEVMLVLAHLDVLAVLVVSFCGRATHSFLTVVSTGVLWVPTVTYPCDAHPRRVVETSERQLVPVLFKCCRGRE